MITIATRGSKLALWQANYIKDILQRQLGNKVVLNVITTTGDKILDKPLAKIGGKGLFVKELEVAIMNGEADMAVHSMKDVPAFLPDGLEIYAYPASESPCDAFLSDTYENIDALKPGAIVGTSSLRRKLQLLAKRPDIQIKDLRGNVDTRIEKMHRGEYDAIILAKAGLVRMGLGSHIRQTISVEDMIPSVCQGILGIEIRQNDEKMKKILDFFKNSVLETRVAVERSFLQTLEGGCQAPIGCHCVVDEKNATLTVTGYLSDLDGRRVFKRTITSGMENPEQTGAELARGILEDGGEIVLKEIYSQ